MPLTDNGIHLTEHGYWEAALFISDQLGQDAALTAHVLVLGQDGKIVDEEGTKASSCRKNGHGAYDSRRSIVILPVHLSRRPGTNHETSLSGWRLAIQDLAPGNV